MSIAPATPTAPVIAAASTQENVGATLFGPEGFGFKTLLDAVNPLQHLPVVSTVYRESTGDTIGAIPRLLGGGLFGGLFGLIGSAVNLVVEAITGKDIGGPVASAFSSPDSNTKIEVARGNYATQRYQQAAALSAEEVENLRGYMIS